MGTVTTSASNLGNARAEATSSTKITAADLRSTLAILSNFVNHTHTITDTYATNCQCQCNCRCNCFGKGCSN